MVLKELAKKHKVEFPVKWESEEPSTTLWGIQE